MSDSADHHPGSTDVTDTPAGTERQLSAAARRALLEAAERRAARDAEAARQGGRPPEFGGQSGPDPARYGDWEKGGIVSDF